MIAHDVEQQFHDRCIRGETLTAEENARLERWYALKDRDEATAFAKAIPGSSIPHLQSQVDAALAQVSTLTQRIQIQTVENENVRREIAALQWQLAQKLTAQRV